MTPEEVKERIEAEIADTEAIVRRARDQHDDDHLAAIVISSTFDGKTLVEQHEAVYDALGDHMTTDIHALELSTYTPEEYDELG